jgi:hypothetical protein
MPFTVVLNGDATILAPVVADDLVEVDRHNAWQYVRLIRHASRWRCAHSRGGGVNALSPSLTIWGVDGHDDELIDIVAPLLCG